MNDSINKELDSIIIKVLGPDSSYLFTSLSPDLKAFMRVFVACHIMECFFNVVH